MKKQIIWQSLHFRTEEDFNACQEEIRLINDDENYELSEEKWWWMVQTELGDENMNLDKVIDGVIIAFGNIGRWNGRVQGYRIFGNNIKNILISSNEVEWFGDTYNIRANEVHHDGENHLLYRVAKDRETAERIGEQIYNGEIDEAGFRRKTKSLYPYVAKIYGWKIRTKK